MQISCKVAVLGRVPVMCGKVVTGSLVGRATGCCPVLSLRVVKAELHALLAAGLGQLADRIAMKGVAATMLKGSALESNMAKPS